MYDGASDIEDEVKQNAREQMNPDLMTGDRERVALAETQQHPTMETAPWVADIPGSEKPLTVKMEAATLQPMTIPHAESVIFAPVSGLSTRQVELIHNNDTLNTGVARQRRLEIIERDMAAIHRFLPRLEEVRAFLATMPTEDDETLGEAKNLSDMKLRGFEREVTATLLSLETELELKT